MKLFVLLALVAAVAADSRTCIPEPVSDVEPLAPPSVTRITSAASLIDPSISSDISILEGISLSSPTFAPVESVIESYARSHYDTLSLLEYYDRSPSAITSPTSVAEMVSDFSSLASAVEELVSEERTHPSLYAIQSSFQALMVYYTSILTAGETSFDFSHASLTSAESGISKAAVTSPSVVTDVEVITTMESFSPSLVTDFSALTEAAEYYSTALHELTTARDWTETDAWYIDTTLKSIESCYPTLFTAVTAIDSFIESHSSDDSAFSRIVSVLTSVPSIITDVTAFVDSVSSSLTAALTAISPVEQVNSHLTTEVTYLDVLEASHPSLSCAEGTLERDLVSNSATVSLIEEELSSPSQVTDSSYVVSLEQEYPSLLTALEEITTVELSHPSLSYVQSEVNYAELVISTVLTDVGEVISATSPSLVGDASDMEDVEAISPTITTALHSLSTIIQASPSLSCAESIIAKYASSAASVLYTIESAVDSPSSVAPSSLAYIAKLTAEYSSLASALRSILSAEYTFPQLSSIEHDVTFALTYEPSLISVYHQVTQYESIVTGEVCSIAPSFTS